MENFQIKIWITYDVAGGLHSRGLQSCDVWFTKPEYHFIDISEINEDDMPFGNRFGDKESIQDRVGWCSYLGGNRREETKCISFGRVFGYGSEFSHEVWMKLCEHFGSDNLREWSNLEKAGIVHPEKFLLEYMLDVKPQFLPF